jgi:hypothetical protein
VSRRTAVASSRSATLSSSAGSSGAPTTTRARERKRPEPPLGLEQDARRAGLQRLQLRLVVADPLRKDGDDAAAGELLVTAREGLEVPRRVDPFVLPPVDRDHSSEIEDPGQDRDLPQRALAQHARRQPERSEEEERIDQAVDVIGDDDQRRARDAPPADDLDTAEEDRQHEAAEEADESVDPPADPRRSRGAVPVQG